MGKGGREKHANCSAIARMENIIQKHPANATMRAKPQLLLRDDCLDKKTDAWMGSGQKKSAHTLRVQEYRRGVGGDAVARVVRHSPEAERR